MTGPHTFCCTCEPASCVHCLRLKSERGNFTFATTNINIQSFLRRISICHSRPPLVRYQPLILSTRSLVTHAIVLPTAWRPWQHCWAQFLNHKHKKEVAFIQACFYCGALGCTHVIKWCVHNTEWKVSLRHDDQGTNLCLDNQSHLHIMMLVRSLEAPHSQSTH
jgi:hypothetical protein